MGVVGDEIRLGMPESRPTRPDPTRGGRAGDRHPWHSRTSLASRWMRIGVLLMPTDPWDDTVRLVQRLEALNYDHVWVYDHLSWQRYRDLRGMRPTRG